MRCARRSGPRGEPVSTGPQEAAFELDHLQDMESGFTIRTSCGELHITAAEARQNPDLIHSVESVLKFRLFVEETLIRKTKQNREKMKRASVVDRLGLGLDDVPPEALNALLQAADRVLTKWVSPWPDPAEEAC